MPPWMMWSLFSVVVVTMLALDLGVFHKTAHAIGVREALRWTAVWVVLAMAFNGVVWWNQGHQKGAEFLLCYLTEQALSVDNIFVFVVIFRYFSVWPENQHRVLFWGILGAVVFRGLFIITGVELVEQFAWTMYILGAFLVFTGVKLFFEKEKEVHPEKNPMIRLVQRVLPLTTKFEGARFTVIQDGKRFATPLLVALVVVETTDIMFAVDSVPAALAITTDRFILYTSNVFAILGLRSLYFAVAGLMSYLHYLQHGLSLILCFIGTKMLLAHYYPIPMQVSLGVVLGVLVLSILASAMRAKILRGRPK
jgi:tellurite resistance protein TerC